MGALAAEHGVPADELYRRTGGNPFYVTEALAAPAEDVPPTVRMAVLTRAARLPPAARVVLDAVSVVPGLTESWLLDATVRARASRRRGLCRRRRARRRRRRIRLPP